MTPDQRQLVLNLIRREISEEEFFRRAGTNKSAQEFALHALRQARESKNADDLEYGLAFAGVYGRGREYLDLLCELLAEEWHHSHEDVVSSLDNLKDNNAVHALYKATLLMPAYLA